MKAADKQCGAQSDFRISIQQCRAQRRKQVRDIHNWADVEPSIFGTLFERLLDPAKRSQIGAHYTSREDIETIVKPVIVEPLRREWAEVKAQCDALWPKIQEESRKQAGKKVVLGKTPKASKPRAAFDKLITDFVQHLSHIRILDPACGSGNFLYVAINLLLDLEKEVITYASTYGSTQGPLIRPSQLSGIEINRYAQELAQVVIWIGYLQWKLHNGQPIPRTPVLDPIESVRCMDAILDLSDPEHPSETEWPEADFIVGNPPFLGGSKIWEELGRDYQHRLWALYEDRLPGFSDLCCYWFEKARHAIERGRTQRVGLIATQSIRGGANRETLKRIKESGDIFFAVSDRDWILDGANVHVAIVGFDNGSEKTKMLDSQFVPSINANLTTSTDTTVANRLTENLDKSFMGAKKGGDFNVPEQTAIDWLQSPNPHGRPNSDVIRPRLNGTALVQRRPQEWIIDPGTEMSVATFSPYEGPFLHVETYVKPDREKNKRAIRRNRWWLHSETAPAMREAIRPLNRFLATPAVAKHRIFAWLDSITLPDQQLFVFASAEDYFLGIVHSRVHEVWARAQGTQTRDRESGFRYTPTTCFETFPFPEPSDAQRDAIAAAARDLDELRNRWLNPPEWTREDVLEFPGSVDGPWRRYVTNPDSRGIGTVRYPRLVPKDDECAKHLAKRTLTNLYNERPTWLDLAHRKLDETVCAAYGWPVELSDDQILERLLALNLERARS